MLSINETKPFSFVDCQLPIPCSSMGVLALGDISALGTGVSLPRQGFYTEKIERVLAVGR